MKRILIKFKTLNSTQIVWGSICLIFLFQHVVEQYIPQLSILDEIFALSTIPLWILKRLHNRQTKKHEFTRERIEGAIVLLLFLSSGFSSNLIWKYQTVNIYMISAIISIKFFLIIESAKTINEFFPLDLETQENAVQFLSVIWFLYFALTQILPNQMKTMYVWDICAKCAVLFALLIFCSHKNMWIYRICMILMLIMLISTQKEKIYGGLILFVILYYLVVHKTVKIKIKYFLYIAVPIILIAWEKIYFYYIQGHGQYAKSIMTETSLRIAKDYFPFGTGFGTYGSTYAMLYYSPVYELYGIAKDPQLGVNSKMYLNDVFWPILFGENGVFGFLCYCGLILLLFITIQKMYYYNKKKYFLAVYLFAYVLLTTFSETGFMQPCVMIMAVILGILLGEYRTKCKNKLEMFYQGERERE